MICGMSSKLRPMRAKRCFIFLTLFRAAFQARRQSDSVTAKGTTFYGTGEYGRTTANCSGCSNENIAVVAVEDNVLSCFPDLYPELKTGPNGPGFPCLGVFFYRSFIANPPLC